MTIVYISEDVYVVCKAIYNIISFFGVKVNKHIEKY